MGKTKVYYIDNELNIKQGYTSANINLNKVSEVVIDYKNNKIKLSSELVSDTKDKLNEQLNKMKVIKLAESYGLKARWINESLEINSLFDGWYVHEMEYYNYKAKTNSKRLIWTHKNKKGSQFDNHEHTQKIMYSNQEEDYRIIFSSIQEHDDYRRVKHSRNHMMEIYDMIKTNNIPKIKMC